MKQSEAVITFLVIDLQKYYLRGDNFFLQLLNITVYYHLLVISFICLKILKNCCIDHVYENINIQVVRIVIILLQGVQHIGRTNFPDFSLTFP